ncbi:hypothetical protein F5883DRAFT_596611 [Diaporthe sp. PMI_573]|nr:hypothetical protein F5883DRAFT_596611 [Diaporthaceae sp. PMI_573]
MADETNDDLGIFQPPHPLYFAQHPEHYWDAEKFGMDLDDVFTTLPKQFNLMAIPILDRESFRLETQHVSSIAHDRAEFYKLLESRLEARRKEQVTMMTRTLSYLASDPEQMELPDRAARHWGHAMHIARSKSFDCIVRFLAGFLRDEGPSDNITTLAAGQDGHLTRQTDAASPTQNSGNVPSASSTASSPRTRKRSFTPATPSLADDNQDEDKIRPTKRIRFADDIVKPRAASPPRRPVSPRATRARKGQPSPVPQPPGSTVPPTTMAPSTSVEARPSADEASGGDPPERCDSVSTSHQIHPGNSRQHLVHPDAEDEGKNNTRKAKRDKGPAATGAQEIRQGSCRPQPRRGKPQAHQPPRTKPSSKIQKSTSSRPDQRASRTTAQGSRSRGAVQLTRSSQRLTRRSGQGSRFFHELDSHGKARSVVA